ncbi:nucleotidyl transferase AbiEii/AbiGii toxin family protein [Spirosoma foliorum]|uniref:Nucleotidyl transferase AbiEii/AbiGii toxin family protein n=1 Tax=Spirosoma foliorum TaxID=2710596 RepID=A0A7G5GRM1_9BACT|nr:nucleotidyl transferase AbiEii/AbiGii toxin family protein [Spirosoma foliorum]QMW01513.1 nucleotidyl transferase AbiEii/AbiGii toxin family protein [Spirosoma foliorum]
MPTSYLHERRDFLDLLRILEDETGIQAGLIEKDYWIMHVLYGLKRQQFDFELKGGTSLSKGYKIIDRFSEDIDIHIQAPVALGVNENPKNTKKQAVEGRKVFYNWLAANIKIEGILSVERDTNFDDTEHYRSGGIRLLYQSQTETIDGVKEGILLEAGFDTVRPNQALTISSWAFDKAIANPKISIIDNRAVDILCYHPGYTFVEKLQTIATKFRQEQQGGEVRVNFMRQYYDVAQLLDNEQVLAFIGTDAYEQHKQARFPKANLAVPIAENEAFLLNDPVLRAKFKNRYEGTSSLYYNGQPEFLAILAKIQEHLHKL